MEAECYPDP